jgi:hypothetical protein
VWLLTRPLGTGAACLLGALLALQCATDLVYLALPVLATTGLVALSLLAQRTTRGDGWRLAGAVGLAILLLLPLIVGYLDLRAANPDLALQTPWRLRLTRTALPSDLVAFRSPTSVAPAAAGLLLLGMVAVVVAGPVQPRLWRHVLLWIAVGTAVSLGPTVVVGGFSLTNHVDRLARAAFPVLDVVRRPDRMRTTALIGLCLLGGLAFATCVRAIQRRWPSAARTAPLLCAVMGAALHGSAQVGWPGVEGAPNTSALASVDAGYPLVPAIEPSAPLLLALRRDDGPVLELPADPRDVGRQARAMYHGLWHRRPVLNGYGSYWPSGFAERMAMAARLPDPDVLRRLRDATGLTTIVVHLDELPPAPRTRWEAALLAPDGAFASRQRVAENVVVVSVGDAQPRR